MRLIEESTSTRARRVVGPSTMMQMIAPWLLVVAVASVCEWSRTPNSKSAWPRLRPTRNFQCQRTRLWGVPNECTVPPGPPSNSKPPTPSLTPMGVADVVMNSTCRRCCWREASSSFIAEIGRPKDLDSTSFVRPKLH